jgi:hypothetical protein
MRIIDLRVPEGMELDNFNSNTVKINELTKDYTCSISCSGFNTRSDYGKRELLKSIRDTIRERRYQFKNSSTNGDSNIWPSLIIVQNYGYGVYGKE